MDRWDRPREEWKREGVEEGRGAQSAHRAEGPQRRVGHEPHRWRRDDRPTTAAEWEVRRFYESFEEPRP